MNPYDIIKSRRLTEKARVLENLQHAKSNPSVSRCQSPKVVFNVDIKANKAQIAWAVEKIYADKIRHAITQVVKNGCVTKDLGGSASTREVTDEVIKALTKIL